jgi:sugar porter (SP) family MFS transporter
VAGPALAEFWFGFEAWRWMYWIEIIPASIFFIGLLFIPESPRYYVIADRKEDALNELKRLYGITAAKRKIEEIVASVASYNNKPRLSDLLDSATKKVKPIVWVGLGLAILQQFVGINIIFYYGAVLWQAVGFSESDALLINIISGAVSIGAVAVTIALIDKIGRKPLLWFGSIGMAISLIVLSIAFSTATLGPDGDLILSDTMGMIALISANVYVIFFNGSWGPVMWVMLGEMFPNQIRGSGLAVSGLAQWGANFTITMTFPILLVSIGLAGAYGMYAAFAVLSIIFVAKMVPETKGKELESMDDLWIDIDEATSAQLEDGDYDDIAPAKS